MNNYYQPVIPGRTYHVFNRAVGNEKLFHVTDNYNYFLKQYSDHMSSVWETYCYCLMPNHFHFLIRTRSAIELERQYTRMKQKSLPILKDSTLPEFVMERVGNFLNGYAKAFNKMYKRKGTLFMDSTKRTLVENDLFEKIVHYIHSNPVHHGLCKNIEAWRFSSYNSILSKLPTKLLREEVIEYFGSKENFLTVHQQPIEFKMPIDLD